MKQIISKINSAGKYSSYPRELSKSCFVVFSNLHGIMENTESTKKVYLHIPEHSYI